ncbi:D-sedoheptulose-7-phosphate isomerase [Actinomadura keratinilytica]|jgi:D-sedoheptulose 7-phosphate isomerase|uniref:D-sedoheptulose-7-phosphate isomerase n=1 Tax=Actinomadura keratinilytica TaxID=547461 RepID=UPI00361A3C2D
MRMAEGRPAAPAVRASFERRAGPGRALAGQADGVARACRDMAERFRGGGRLIVFGSGGAAADAQHIAVEFVHPVIVGKRALPAVSLTDDAAALTGIAAAEGPEEVFAAQVRLLGAPHDIALGLSADGRCPEVRRGLAAARGLGMLTVALAGAGGGDVAAEADHPLTTPCDDPCVVKEMHVTLYHLLWELVHVFLEHPATAERSDGHGDGHGDGQGGGHGDGH